MKLGHKIVMVLIVGILGYAAGRYAQPAEVVTKIEEKIVEVERVKIEYRTITRTITNPDGTTIKEEIKEEIRQNEEISSTERKEETKTIYLKPQWKAQVAAELSNFQPTNYRVGLERRILGPVFLGAWAETTFDSYGVSISLEL